MMLLREVTLLFIFTIFLPLKKFLLQRCFDSSATLFQESVFKGELFTGYISELIDQMSDIDRSSMLN